MLELLNKLSKDNFLDEDCLFLVDVRTSEEYNSGSVDGSINIPLSILEQELSQFKNKKNTIVFCRSGARSGNAKLILESNGFENVTNGGSWQNVQQILNEFNLKIK